MVTPGGRALFASDVTSNRTAPLDGLDESLDLRPLLSELTRDGNVIYASNPELLAWMVREDPYLAAKVTWSPPLDAWLWHDGPDLTFLVYAAEMRRSPAR